MSAEANRAGGAVERFWRLRWAMTDHDSSASWRSRLIETHSAMQALLRTVKRVAVIGIKTAESGQP